MSLKLFILIVIVTGCQGNRTALFSALFGSYNSDVRPTCGSNATIQVQIGMAVRQIIDIDEPKQTMFSNVWMRLKWYDCNLVWTPGDYGGIDVLVVPFSKVWSPDVTLFDNADDGLPGMQDYRPSISSDGSVSYNFPTVIHSMCAIDVTAFPFDTQRCPLTFGSWVYNGLQIDITALTSAGDISDFKKNSEWEMVGVPQERHVVYYGCCPEPFPDMTFYVTLRRKPLYYILNILFPCLLISQIALLGFMLPAESGEKIGLELTVLLSLAVLMMVVSETLPPTSENFPLLGVYFVIAMAFVTISTVLTVVVINVYFRGALGHKVPRWVRVVFLGHLARLLRVTNTQQVHPNRAKSGLLEKCKSPMSMSVKVEDHVVQDMQIQDLDLSGKSSATVSLLEEQLRLLKKVDQQANERQEEEQMENEWKTLSVVCDRLFLLVFFVASVASTIGILVESNIRA